MNDIYSGTALYMAQYAGNGQALIYSPMADCFAVLVFFLIVIGLLIIADVL